MATLTNLVGSETLDSKSKKYTFSTEGKYVSGDIEMTITAKDASITYAGGAASIKSSSTSATNGSGVTMTDTDTDPGSGVYFTTGGSATPKRSAVTFTGTSGWYGASSTAATACAAANGSATTLSTNKYYITGITVPASKTFTSFNLASGTSSNRTYLNTMSVPSYTTIKKIDLKGIIDEISIQGGYAHLKPTNSTSDSRIYINAYDNADTPVLTGEKQVVSNGKWISNIVTPDTSEQGPYYGMTIVNAMDSAEYDSNITFDTATKYPALVTTAGYTATNRIKSVKIVPPSGSTLNEFQVMVPNGNTTDYITFTFKVDKNGNTWVE